MIDPAILETAIKEFHEKGNAIYDSDCEITRLSLSNYEQFGITRKQAKEYLKDKGLVRKVPHPNPTGAKERLQRLIQYRAPFMFEIERLQFIEKYGEWKAAFIEAELKQIDKEIAQAQEMPFAVAASTETEESIGREYLRLKEGFYEAAILPDDALTHISKTSKAYGRYFLFREYLQKRLSTLLENKTENKFLPLVETHLAFLSGKSIKNNERILSSTDYKTLIEATSHYLKTGEIKDGIKPIQHVNTQKEVYIYALRQLHIGVFGKKWKGNFFPLLQKLFVECSPTKVGLESLKRNYTKVPKGYDKFTQHGEKTSQEPRQ